MKNTNQHLLDIRKEHCPEWYPDWSDESTKFYLEYDHMNNTYQVGVETHWEILGVIYFPSREVAKIALEHIESLYSERLSIL